MINPVPVSDSLSVAASSVTKAGDILPAKSVSNTHQDLPSFPTLSAATINNPQTVSTRGRDVVILNPYTQGGGDHALGNSISRIVLEEGGRASIVPINAENFSIDPHRNVSLSSNCHDIRELTNPIFIVAPVGILSTKKLGMVIDDVCLKFPFEKGKVLLLEEMDLLSGPNQSLTSREDMLRSKGFSHVTSYNLGFGSEGIGYLPVNEGTLNDVKGRADTEISNLLDGYNIDINKNSNMHFAYISDDTQVTSAQIFISNTLTETKDDTADSNYVIVFRNYNDRIPDHLKDIFKFKSEELGLNNPSLFGSANISYLEPQSGKLEPLFKLDGDGLRNVNVVLTSSLPRNIFLDLMFLSKSGMASGDQSLSEYISFKGEFPYYNKQPWKDPLVAGVKDMAESYGCADLTDKIEQMVVGRRPFSGAIRYKFSPNSENTASKSPELKDAWKSLSDRLSSRRADVKIRNFLSSSAGDAYSRGLRSNGTKTYGNP